MPKPRLLEKCRYFRTRLEELLEKILSRPFDEELSDELDLFVPRWGRHLERCSSCKQFSRRKGREVLKDPLPSPPPRRRKK